MDEANEKDFNDLKSAINYSNSLSPGIGKSLENNVAIFKGKLQQKQLLKLVGFKFTRHKLYNLSDEKLELLEELIRHRVNLMLNIKNKNMLDELEVKSFDKEFRFEDIPLNLKDKALEEIEFALNDEGINNISANDVTDNYLFCFLKNQIIFS